MYLDVLVHRIPLRGLGRSPRPHAAGGGAVGASVSTGEPCRRLFVHPGTEHFTTRSPPARQPAASLRAVPPSLCPGPDLPTTAPGPLRLPPGARGSPAPFGPQGPRGAGGRAGSGQAPRRPALLSPVWARRADERYVRGRLAGAGRGARGRPARRGAGLTQAAPPPYAPQAATAAETPRDRDRHQPLAT